MSIGKPYSQSCENNQSPILEILRGVFTQPLTVWEIGSGTGQHACYFGRHLPHLTWQPSDREENLPGIAMWLQDAGLDNVKPPLILDVNDKNWPCEKIQALFTANTLHIMSLREVETLFDNLEVYLAPLAVVCIYGPFNYQGEFTSESNAQFDQWLKRNNPESGIRDFEKIDRLATVAGLKLTADHSMPANNRLLVFERSHPR